MNISDKNIQIVDSTLREGQQAIHPRSSLAAPEGVVLSREEQLGIVRQLIAFGVDYIEIGAPVYSPFALETAQMIVSLVHKLSHRTKVLVHARCTKDDVDSYFGTGADGIELYLGTSEANRGKRSLDQTIEMALTTIEYIKERAPDTFIRFSTEDAYRTPLPDLMRVIDAVKDKVDRIGLPDTTGVAHYSTVHEVIHNIKRSIDTDLQFHSHNDDGLVVARYLEAVRAGATVLDVTLLGIGERNGIISLSQLISMLHTHGYKDVLEQKYNLSLLPQIESSFASMLEIPVPHTSPLSSPGSSAHVAGVHTNAMLRDQSAYQGIDFAVFDKNPILVTASSVVGGDAIRERARQIGVEMSREVAKNTAMVIREYARRHGGISQDQVDAYIRSHSYCSSAGIATV